MTARKRMSQQRRFKSLVVTIDEQLNEALYVNGRLVSCDGPTVYACDIAAHSTSEPVKFSHIEVEGVWENNWPGQLKGLTALAGRGLSEPEGE